MFATVRSLHVKGWMNCTVRETPIDDLTSHDRSGFSLVLLLRIHIEVGHSHLNAGERALLKHMKFMMPPRVLKFVTDTAVKMHDVFRK